MISVALQRGVELGVARGARRVPVDGVGAGLDLRLGEAHHVVGRHRRRFLLGGARLGDARLGQQRGPVLAGAVGLGVEAQVGHDAVLQRGHGGEQGVMHDLGLVGHDRAHDLERVVAHAELEQVGAHPLLVGLQVLGARGVRLHAGAVAAEDHLVAHVDPREAGRRRVDVEQVVELVLRQRRHLGALDRRLGARLELGLDLAARQMGEGAVAHAGRDRRFHRATTPSRSRNVARRAPATGRRPGLLQCYQRGRRRPRRARLTRPPRPAPPHALTPDAGLGSGALHLGPGVLVHLLEGAQVLGQLALVEDLGRRAASPSARGR